MPLTQEERNDIDSGKDGANKLIQLDRMTASELDSRFLHVGAVDDEGNALPDKDIAKARAKTIKVLKRFKNADYVRALINITGYDGSNLVTSADNDYSNAELGNISAFVERFEDESGGFSIPRHSVKALKRFNAIDADLAILIPTATTAQRRRFIRELLKL